MRAISLGELGRNTSRVVAEVERTNRPTLVTREGTLVAAIVPIREGDLDEPVLGKLSNLREAEPGPNPSSGPSRRGDVERDYEGQEPQEQAFPEPGD